MFNDAVLLSKFLKNINSIIESIVLNFFCRRVIFSMSAFNKAYVKVVTSVTA